MLSCDWRLSLPVFTLLLHSQVFSLSQIYTPDNLRTDNKANATANLRDIVLPGAALNGSWPTIGALRGKILFFADPDYTSELEAE